MTDAVKESNEELKHFAYIVSHDLRAPLVNIKGFAAELRRSLEEIGSQVNSERRAVRQRMQRARQHTAKGRAWRPWGSSIHR